MPENLFNFSHSYQDLPDILYAPCAPANVSAPELICFNDSLAKSIDVDASNLNDACLANIFSGDQIIAGSQPICQAYAGHQYGRFTNLGDGRAHLLGEHVIDCNTRFDIQLKGSGQTKFSRAGDGKSALGPMLREYLISEAMFYLGIPTTRSLAVVKTGDHIQRESILPGAVLTRVARSHIRIGTFEFAAFLTNPPVLKDLLIYTIKRHFSDHKNTGKDALAFLDHVMNQQIKLIVGWMRVGFIHGVLNTDNVSIVGDTLDYGPCAFLDEYNPSAVFSSIDHFGRYSFDSQAQITQWNLVKLAEALLPLIDEDQNIALKLTSDLIQEFSSRFNKQWLNMMRKKLGLFGSDPKDLLLINELLSWMHSHQADYTKTFYDLSYMRNLTDQIYQTNEFKQWYQRWQSRINQQRLLTGKTPNEIMKKNNPVIIPRNHIIDRVIQHANLGDYTLLYQLCEVLKTPYNDDADKVAFKQPPAPHEKIHQTFCGT